MPTDEPRRRLADILTNLTEIEDFIAGLDEAGFVGDKRTRYAVERCLQRITEAARKLGTRYDAAYPALELPKLRRFGSVLRHDYDVLDPRQLWATVTPERGRLAALRRFAEQELARLPPGAK